MFEESLPAATIAELDVLSRGVFSARGPASVEQWRVFAQAARNLWQQTDAPHQDQLRRELARLACALSDPAECDDSCFRFVDEQIALLQAKG